MIRLLRLAGMAEDISPRIADRLERLASKKGSGFEAFLLSHGVDPVVVEFVRDGEFPPKMKKWLAFKLNDDVRRYPSHEKLRVLEGQRESLITLRDWADYHMRRPGFNIDAYKDLDHALEAARDWHSELAREMEGTGHPSLYRNREGEDLGNGFRMVEVPFEDLDNEGNLMGHCVGQGSYDAGVQDGTTKIFSLRDADGFPHVTIELHFDMEDQGEEEDWGQDEDGYYSTPFMRISSTGTIEQIQGKEDSPPIDRYRGPVKEWMQRHDGEFLTVQPQQWLQVTPDPELFDMIVKSKADEEKYRLIIGNLSDETAEKVWDLILERYGWGWNDFAVSQTLRRRDPHVYHRATPEQIKLHGQLMELSLESPREEIRKSAYQVVADTLVPDEDGHKVPYSSTPEGIEYFARVLREDPSPIVVGSVIGEYTRSRMIPGTTEWVNHPPFPPQIREAVIGVLPRLMSRDPHLGDNRDLMFHIEESMKHQDLEADLLPDYLETGNKYPHGIPKWSNAGEALGRLHYSDRRAYEGVLSKISPEMKRKILDHNLSGQYRMNTWDDMYSDLLRRAVSEGWMDPKTIRPDWIEKIWPRDGSYGVPPWMEAG